MTTITVTFDEADMILNEMWRWHGDGGSSRTLAVHDREGFAATLTWLHRAFDVMEQLGWESGGETFELTVTTHLVDLLSETRRDALEMVEHDRAGRKKSLHDLGGYGAAPTMQENLRVYDAEIAMYEREAQFCADLLARIEQQAVPV